MQPTNEPTNQQPQPQTQPMSGPPEYPQQPAQVITPSTMPASPVTPDAQALPNQPVTPAAQTPQEPAGSLTSQFEPPQPVQEPMQQPTPQNDGPSRSRKPLIIALVIVACLIIGAAAFLFMQKDSGKNEDANAVADRSSQNTSTPGAKDVSDLTEVSFIPPADMAEYSPNAGTAVFANHELLAPAGDSDQCRLSFGVAESFEIPGTDIASVVQPQIDSLTKAGAKVEGPKAGKALVLQADDGQSYQLPTLEFTVTKDGAREVDQFSVAILKNDKRVIVTRACSNPSGQVNDKNIQTLEATAQKLKLSVK